MTGAPAADAFLPVSRAAARDLLISSTPGVALLLRQRHVVPAKAFREIAALLHMHRKLGALCPLILCRPTLFSLALRRRGCWSPCKRLSKGGAASEVATEPGPDGS
jgi:hypothetical protein